MSLINFHRLCQNLASHSSNNESHRIRVVFLTDVAGVYDRAPRLPGASLIKRINVHPNGTVRLRCVLRWYIRVVFFFGISFYTDISSWAFSSQTDLVAATETAAHDVTGGIEAKLQVRGSCKYIHFSPHIYMRPFAFLF